VCLAILAVSPLVYWNMTHDYIGLVKQGGRIGFHPFQPKMLPEFLGAFIGLFTPLLVIMAGFGLKKLNFKPPNPQWQLIFLTAAPLFLYMLWYSLFDRVQGNWLAPLLPCVILLAIHAPFQQWQKFTAPFGIGLSLVLLAFILIFPTLLPKGPMSQFKDWDKLAAEILKQNEPLLLTSHYTMNAQLSYALRGKMHVRQCDEPERYLMQPPFTPPPFTLMLSEEKPARPLAILPHNDKIYYLSKPQNCRIIATL
jgi:hypothetical protein